MRGLSFRRTEPAGSLVFRYAPESGLQLREPCRSDRIRSKERAGPAAVPVETPIRTVPGESFFGLLLRWKTFGSPRCDISIKQGCCCRAGPQAVFTRPLAPEELPRTAPFGSRSIRGSGGFLSWGLCPSGPVRVVVIRFGGCRSLRRIPALSVYTARSTGIGDACPKAGGLGIRVSRKGASFPPRLSCKTPKRAFGTPNRRLERYIRPVLTGRTTVHKRKE